MSKKDKQAVKRDALIKSRCFIDYPATSWADRSQRISVGLESSHSPYSKSHTRRMKRKAKEQVGGGMQDIALALSSFDNLESEETIAEVDDSGRVGGGVGEHAGDKIGEGRANPRNNHQRKQIL